MFNPMHSKFFFVKYTSNSSILRIERPLPTDLLVSTNYIPIIQIEMNAQDSDRNGYLESEQNECQRSESKRMFKVWNAVDTTGKSKMNAKDPKQNECVSFNSKRKVWHEVDVQNSEQNRCPMRMPESRLKRMFRVQIEANAQDPT